MNKIRFFTIVLALIISSMLYASEEKQELKGNLKITNYIHPVLDANGVTYVLMMPRYMAYDFKDGTEATVEGYLLNNYGNGDNNYQFLYVTSLTVNGKTYDIDRFRGRMMGRGYGYDRDDENDRYFHRGYGHGCW